MWGEIIMDKKQINKQIRAISSTSSLPLLIFMIVTLVGGFLRSSIYNSADFDSIFRNKNILYAIQNLVVYPVLMPILYLIFYKTRGKSQGRRLKDLFKKPERSAGWCIKWIIICIGISQIVNKIFLLALDYILPKFGIYLNQHDSNMEANIFGFILLIISLSVFAPLFEELLFRGIIYRNNENTGQLFAIIISGLAFGLWHTNYTQTVMASICGMSLCFIFAKTKSIIPCIICHFVNNTIVGIMTITTHILGTPLESKDIEFKLHYMFTKHFFTSCLYSATGLLLLLIYILGVIFIIYELIKNRHKLNFAKDNFGISTLKKTIVYFSSPITFITYAGMLFLSINSIFK